jgi:CRP-like cAMP-binding protein
MLQPYLQSVALPFRHRLQAANSRIPTIAFIESGLGSVVAIGGKRRQAEVGVIGREGMTGLPIVLGAERSPCEICQSIDADHLSDAMDRSLTMARCFQRFAHVFAVQASCTALANAQGRVEERLARWLLMAHDRIGSDMLKLTHEFLALMLGVRRAGVTTALRHLEQNAIIDMARGVVTIVDRGRLEECADGLYGQPEAEFERLFPASQFTAAISPEPTSCRADGAETG